MNDNELTQALRGLYDAAEESPERESANARRISIDEYEKQPEKKSAAVCTVKPCQESFCLRQSVIVAERKYVTFDYEAKEMYIGDVALSFVEVAKLHDVLEWALRERGIGDINDKL